MRLSTSPHVVQTAIGNLLRIGVITAAVVVLAGGIWLVGTSGSQAVSFSPFRGEPALLRSVTGIATSLFAGDSRVLIQAGLLLLIATPIARVLFALGVFALQKDWLYVVITMIVLTALLFSLSGG